MSTTAEKLVKQAQEWVGVKEGSAKHKEIVSIYNNHRPLARGYKAKTTSAWCALYVSACAIKTGATDIIPTEVSCIQMINLFKKKGVWIENENRTPNVGDIIFYDWDDSGKGDAKGSSAHVGIVEKVKEGVITVIEGNIDSAVKRRTIKVNGRYIRGYGVPKYDVPTAAKPTAGALVDKKEETAEKSIDELAKEVLDGKYGVGAARAKALGSKYAEVQARVNEMLREQRADDTPKVGDKVIIVANGKSTANGGTSTNCIGMTRYVTAIHKGKDYPYQVGNKGKTSSIHTTGFFKADAIKKV